MKIIHQCTFALFALIVVLLNSGCASLPKVDAKTEEQAIRDLETQLATAVAKRDLEAAVAIYAPDATVLAPGAPAETGAEAIRANFAAFFKTPGLVVNFGPEKLHIAAAGDMATEVGRFGLEFDGAQGHVKQEFKYLDVWRKTNGQWKVIYDTWNANSPLGQ